MSSSRLGSLVRGWKGQCPRCRSREIFATHYRLKRECPQCQLPLENEDGWSLGAIPLNYGLTCVLWILPIGLLFLLGIISDFWALLLAGIGAVVLPFVTYRFSKAAWVGLYFAVLPHELDTPSEKRKGTPG